MRREEPEDGFAPAFGARVGGDDEPWQMDGVEVAAVGPADEDGDIDRPQHGLVVGAVAEPDRPDGSPAQFVERPEGPDGPALVAPADEMMEASAAQDLQADGPRRPGRPRRAALDRPRRKARRILASAASAASLAREAAALGDLVDGHVAEAAEREAGRGRGWRPSARRSCGVGPADLEDAVSAVAPVENEPRARSSPPGTKTAPPFSTMKGWTLARARRQRFGLGRVLLVQKTTGMPASRRASSAGRDGSKE